MGTHVCTPFRCGVYVPKATLPWGGAEAVADETARPRETATQFPMYVLPVGAFLELSEWHPHQALLADGKLRVWDESMRGKVFFVSHQWCAVGPARVQPSSRHTQLSPHLLPVTSCARLSCAHPDPDLVQLEVLQTVLARLLRGEIEVKGNFWVTGGVPSATVH